MNQDGINSRAMNKIMKARITELPKKLGNPLPGVLGYALRWKRGMLFTYFPNEFSFLESDFMGLTEEEARRLKFGRDRASLRS